VVSDTSNEDTTTDEDEVERDADLEEAELEAPAEPTPIEPERAGISADHRNIMGGTAQNVLGVVVFALATAVAQVLMARSLDRGVFGVVTEARLFAYIAASATRFGMDVACVRLVAILIGRGEQGRVRRLVNRALGIAAAISVGFGAVAFLIAGWLAGLFTPLPDAGRAAFQAAAVGIPLGALAFTYLGATRGFKIMRFTLYGQWAAQPVTWVLFMLAAWTIGYSAGLTTLAYSLSWGAAMLIGLYGWKKLTRGLGTSDEGVGVPEEHTGALLRFGAFRAPAALFSHLIFFTDLYVLNYLWSRQGVAGALVSDAYGATIQVAQSLFLFLTSVSLTFSPFVADLHHRQETERLNGLYKTVTRWALAATIPIMLVLAVVPEEVLRVFGKRYAVGAVPLRILIVGMIVPVMVGTVGFILIMVGRTGWDLLVYVAGFGIDVVVAAVLARPESLGMRGAAIAQACTLSFSAVVRLVLVHRFVHIWPFNRQYLRLVVPTVAAAVTVAGVHAVLPAQKWLVNLAGSAVAGTVVYGLLVLAIGLTPTERRTLAGLVKRFTGRAGAASR